MISKRNRYLLLGFFSLAVFLLLWVSLDYSQLQFISSTVVPQFLILAVFLSVLSIMFRAIGWYVVLSIENDTSFSFREILVVFTGSLGAKYVVPGGSFTVQPIVSYYIGDSKDVDSETILARLSIADALLLAPFFTVSFLSAIYLLQSELSYVHYVLTVCLVLIIGTSIYYRESLLSFLQKILPESISFERLNVYLPFFSVPKINISRIQRYLRYVTTHASSVITGNYTLLFGLLILGGMTAITYSLVFWTSALALGSSITIGTALLIGWGSQVGRAVPLPGGIGGVEVAGTTLILLSTEIPFGKAVLIIVLYRILTFWGVVGIGWLIVTSRELLATENKTKFS